MSWRIASSEGGKVNPTGEVVARVIWNRVAPKVAEAKPNLKLVRVIIAESASGKVSYAVEED